MYDVTYLDLIIIRRFHDTIYIFYLRLRLFRFYFEILRHYVSSLSDRYLATRERASGYVLAGFLLSEANAAEFWDHNMEDDDDLDELLDEVERTFCKNVSVSAASGQSNEALKRGKDEAGQGRYRSVMLM